MVWYKFGLSFTQVKTYDLQQAISNRLAHGESKFKIRVTEQETFAKLLENCVNSIQYFGIVFL